MANDLHLGGTMRIYGERSAAMEATLALLGLAIPENA